MIVTPSDFSGEYSLPQLGQVEVENTLKDFISRLEPEFLKDAMGYEVSQLFISGVENEEERWMDIVNGVEFQNYAIKQKYNGIKLDIVRYVYYHFVEWLNSQIVGTGTVRTKSEGSTPVVPTSKAINAWNAMVKSVRLLDPLFFSKREVYPEYKRWEVSFRSFESVNMFGV